MIATAAVAIQELPVMDHPLTRFGGTQADATTSLELVIRANAGEEAAVAALYERYRPRLQRWAHSRLPPWPEARCRPKTWCRTR